MSANHTASLRSETSEGDGKTAPHRWTRGDSRVMRLQPGFLAILLFSSLAFAQQPLVPDTPAKPTIRGSADEVILDVVVRDKKGKEVRDLTSEDVEVLDNGVKQQIKSFRRVEGKEALTKGASQALDPLRQIRLITLVFEGLSPSGRQFARKAALDVLNGAQVQNQYYAVMTIDTQLSVVQQFTGDRALLKRAVERATGGTFTEFIADTERIRGELRRQLGLAPDGRTLEEQVKDLQTTQAAPNTPPDANSVVSAKVAQVMLNMLQMHETFDRNEASRASILALLAMIRGQATLPGRKTILYFSEGLRVPTNLDVPFQNVISAANRANVSFYAIDARGVGAAGVGSAASDLAGAAASSRSQAQSDGSGPVNRDQVMAADRAEEGMRGNVQAKLKELSEGTGGFMISDTNDLKTPLRRVNEEINAYYEISYNPEIETYDGRFHKTTVRMLRADAKAVTRNGYFALPPSSGGADTSALDVPSYQAAMLKALGTSPLPRDVEFKSAAMRFNRTADGTWAAVVIEVPLKGMQFEEDKAKKTYTAHLSVMALVKDSKGEVVKRLGKDLPLQGPLEQLAGVRQANFTYKEHFELVPGRYTVETAVLDQKAVKIGAKRASFVVPPKQAGVGISNLSVVRRFEANAKDLDPEDPFRLQGGRVTPSLAATIAGGKGALLSIFFVVFPDASIAEKPQAMIEYLQDGKSVGRGAVELPPADAQGRIAYVMSSPAESMPPGTYEIHAVVKQGATAADERTFVTIEPPGAPQ